MSSNHNYYVYIVECKDGSYYTGITSNIEHRIYQHHTGFYKECYTYERRPVELKYVQRFQVAEQAIKWEKQVKGWSRKKKQALFNEDWNTIQELSRNSTNNSKPNNTSTGSV